MNDLIPEIYICVEKHESEYPIPIILSEGDKVKLGERAPEPGWYDWIWAETIGGQSGWIPIQIIHIDNDLKQGIVQENYSSKELNISVDSKVTKIKTLNGWSWVRNLETNEEGWIPDLKLQQTQT
ncbi:SH3 domain-containing protein [Aquiflexum lacus]|uniref:SH3 domain-containing protein n=1 Tax=Aquiflexum lacus TaxID=2483805 RepID=UPI001893ACD3|nr:SH3 domain-containing protein [Aquiflexum lacus]